MLSLTACGLTTGEVVAHFDGVYGVSVSKDTISRITDNVIEGMTLWQIRPLDRVYPVVFIDALVVKVRDGQVGNKPFYIAVGVTVNGGETFSGSGPATAAKAAKFWLVVLTEIKNRGAEDVCVVVCDDLKGLPESINTAWPLATVQTCIIHLIRNTFRFASRHYREEIGKDLRPVYTAPTEATTSERRRQIDAKWGSSIPRSRSSDAMPGPSSRRSWTGMCRDPQDHLLDERDRVSQHPLPARGPRPRVLPQRRGHAHVALPRDPLA